MEAIRSNAPPTDSLPAEPDPGAGSGGARLLTSRLASTLAPPNATNPGPPESDRTRQSRPARAFFSIALVAAIIWLAAVVGALTLMEGHANQPGPSGTIPAHWPRESLIPLDARRPTLIFFAHPRCPCTRASLGELELLLARCQGQVSAHVVFIRPAGTSEDWAQTDLWREAAAIPGVSIHSDSAGVETRRFHSETSGQTVLYDPEGRLLFEGGITLSRGHSGDNPGRSALVALLERQVSDRTNTPVFGCSLVDPESRTGGVE